MRRNTTETQKPTETQRMVLGAPSALLCLPALHMLVDWQAGISVSSVMV